ncbi:hypothetical protein [Alcanivorax sp.]|jgi:hypothetical protein|uniref:hypothetical protein n=1 Tax=Alcanivorax sp. TaxID=1872427 RepID=UPI0032D98509
MTGKASERSARLTKNPANGFTQRGKQAESSKREKPLIERLFYKTGISGLGNL